MDEKFDEKGMDKQQEKSPQEKSWDEKWRRDPLSAIVWAAIFIWAGFVFLADNLGLFAALIGPEGVLSRTLGKDVGAWPIVLIGAGIILLIEVAARLLIPVYRGPVMGTVIFAIILIGVGLGDLINWSIIGALIIIAIGVSILVRGLKR